MPPLDRIATDPEATLPDAVDVAIIGGGIVGISTAWQLARRGLRVAVFEKGRVAGEQSSRNWGWCRQQGRDPAEIPLMVESLRIWRGINDALGAETGFRQNGILWATENPSDEARWHDWMAHAEPYQIGTQLLSADQVAEKWPSGTKRWAFGVWTPSDGQAEPALAVPAMARDCQASGVTIVENCAVRGLERSGGAVSGIVTERGRVRAAAVLLAGGAWTRLFCRSLGVAFKSLNIRASVLRTTPGPEVLSGAMGTDIFCVRRRADGCYTVARLGASTYDVVPDGVRWFSEFWPAYMKERKNLRVRIGASTREEMSWPRSWSLSEETVFERRRTWDPEPDQRAISSALKAFRGAFPELAGLSTAETWAGMIDGTPDQVPVISPVDAIPGFYVASGFSGHGFGIGPGAGRLAADLISGSPPVVDPTPYRMDRFN